ncbi:hypothetical protein [Paenibacillus macerans]|uniref:hypothetical protein n=1 Tax=Paenibacillus macerans TaxID=44252 RepID=UPI003D31E9E1
MDFFKRGYVSWTSIPETIHTADTPKPGFFLSGKHMSIVLHDQDSPDIRKDIALIVPITSAKYEWKKLKGKGDMPVNRNWMDQYLGELNPGLMELVDFQVIQNIGLMEMVMKMAHSLYQEQLEKMDQAAATIDFFDVNK